MRTAAGRFGVSIVIALVVLAIGFSTGYTQDEDRDDVVHLKDGRIIRGTIIEQAPDEGLILRTEGGNVYVFTADEILRVAKEREKVTPSVARKVRNKSGGRAFLYSLILPGGGQFYNGESGKGAAMLGAVVLGAGLIIANSTHRNGTYYVDNGSEGIARVGQVLMIGGALWSLIDAPISSARINRRKSLATLDFISDDLYVDVDVSDINGRTTPMLKASLSF